MKTESQREAVTYRYYVILLLFVVLAAACKKTVHPPAEVPQPVTDARTIRLKQLVAEKLPSPYFFFSYDNQGFVDSIAFASGFFEYTVSYKNKRISEMFNRGNSWKLLYEYKGTAVSSIIELNAAQQKINRHKFQYNPAGKLIAADTYVFSNAGADSNVIKHFDLNYHPDGNLSKLSEWRRDIATNILVNYTNTEYDNYDNKKNVDDFYLLKDSWGHLLFLPQVKLQINNPGTVLIHGLSNDYKITNTFEFNDQQLPIVKHQRMEQVRGSNAGTVLKFKNDYTYY
jgi:hypothetical protein